MKYIPSVEKLKEREEEIIRMYQSGATYKTITEKLKIGPAIIKRALIENDLQIRNRSDYSAIVGKEREIADFYLSGASYGDICEKYKIASSVVKRILEFYKIDPRMKNRSKIRKRVDLSGRVEMYFNLNRSLAFIAKKCSCSRDAVKQFLRTKGYSEIQISRGTNNVYRDDEREINMKSPLEVEFAKYLSEYKIHWKYESITIDEINFKYTPDFVIYNTKGIPQYIIDVKKFSARFGGRKEKKFNKVENIALEMKKRISFFKEKFDSEFVITGPTNLKLVVEGIYFNLRGELL